MRRLFILLMLCLLPLQISWAAVANYCDHEQGANSQHFGHHEDEHNASHVTPDSDKQPGQSGAVNDHSHLSSFLGVPSSFSHTTCNHFQTILHHDDWPYPSLVAELPERPNWLVPA